MTTKPQDSSGVDDPDETPWCQRCRKDLDKCTCNPIRHSSGASEAGKEVIKKALIAASRLPTHQGCAEENHAVVILAWDALKAFDYLLSSPATDSGGGEGKQKVWSVANPPCPRCAELEQWKQSQLAVESEWSPQTVGKLLGLTLGQSIRANIQPKIEELLARIANLEADKRRLEEVIKQAACDLTCRENDTHFCPICDNSLYNAKVRIDAAIARNDAGKASKQAPRELPKSAAMEKPEAKETFGKPGAI
jgi:hypothetical protein